MNTSAKDDELKVATLVPAFSIYFSNTMTMVKTFATDGPLLFRAEEEVYKEELNDVREALLAEISSAKKMLPVKKDLTYRVCQIIKRFKSWRKT